MMPVCLGCVEALSHTAGIFIFHRKVPYTPGMATAWLLLITSIYIFVTGFSKHLATVGNLLLGLLFVIILFVFFMQLALRQMGFSMSELVKRIK